MTDNVPLHVLGGSIVPMALGKQFMLTSDVRNASLAFVVAFPAENSTVSGARLHACSAPALPANAPIVSCVWNARRFVDPALLTGNRVAADPPELMRCLFGTV